MIGESLSLLDELLEANCRSGARFFSARCIKTSELRNFNREKRLSDSFRIGKRYSLFSCFIISALVSRSSMITCAVPRRHSERSFPRFPPDRAESRFHASLPRRGRWRSNRCTVFNPQQRASSRERDTLDLIRLGIDAKEIVMISSSGSFSGFIIYCLRASSSCENVRASKQCSLTPNRC